MTTTNVPETLIRVRRDPRDPSSVAAVRLVEVSHTPHRHPLGISGATVTWEALVDETPLGKITGTESILDHPAYRDLRVIGRNNNPWESFDSPSGQDPASHPTRADAARHLLNLHLLTMEGSR